MIDTNLIQNNMYYEGPYLNPPSPLAGMKN